MPYRRSSTTPGVETTETHSQHKHKHTQPWDALKERWTADPLHSKWEGALARARKAPQERATQSRPPYFPQPWSTPSKHRHSGC
jgi:hypothetical protein